MSEHAKEDPIFDALLKEAAGNDAPDVRLRVLQAAKDEGLLEGDVPNASPAHADASPTPPARRMGSLVAILGWAAAACALVAIGWVIFSRNEPAQQATPGLPSTVTVAESGSFQVRQGGVYLDSGVALVRHGAPALHVGGNTVDGVNGMALVSPGGIPRDSELNQLESQLRRGGQLKPEEMQMLKNRKKWILSGGVALCVLAGSVAFNGDVVDAQMVRNNNTDKKVTDKKATDKKVTDKRSNTNGQGAGGIVIKKEDPKVAKKKEEELKKRTDKKVDDFFSKIDKNGDGVVSKGEAKKALGAEAGGTMKKMDDNKDGKISRGEAEKHFGDETKKEDADAAKTSSGRKVIGMGGAGGIVIKEPSKESSNTDKKQDDSSAAKSTDRNSDANSKKTDKQKD